MKRTRDVSARSSVASVRYERPAIDTYRTLLAAAAVVGMVVLSGVASREIYSRLVRAASERSSTPLYGEGLTLPAEPRLEGIEMMSTKDVPVVAAEDRLQTYGWVDRQKKIVHIPIGRAMELAVEQGWLRTATPGSDDGSKRSDMQKTSDGKQLAR